MFVVFCVSNIMHIILFLVFLRGPFYTCSTKEYWKYINNDTYFCEQPIQNGGVLRFTFCVLDTNYKKPKGNSTSIHTQYAAFS